MLSELPVRKSRPQARRNEHRKPRRSFMPTRRVADDRLPGLLDSMPGAVAIARANNSDSSMTERNAEASASGCRGTPRSPV